ncbi:MAG: pyrrolo-quinoline quinone [Acidobacteriia bacterium]|nr:pyrrolo-quinoline quinone [Terriglobia bacterium]
MSFRALAGLLFSILCLLNWNACSTNSSTPEGSGSPSITSQPSSLTVQAGQTATFTVGARGAAPLGYQWQKNGSDISGATAASYTTPPTSGSDDGSTFRAVVSNSMGSVTSNPATLTVSSSMSAVDVTTYHNDNARTGQNLAETLLNPGNVNSTNFGKVGFFPVDGKVDAQPLYLSNVNISGQGTHNVLYVVTEHASVYAFDAAGGTVLWQVSVLGTGETTSDTRSCSQVTPEIGITATPVIDQTRGPNGAIYVVAMSKSGSTYFQRLHALDLTTGAELFGGPKNIQASFLGSGDGSSGGMVIFDPKQYEERAGMLLLNGTVYMAWTSHCDIRPYTGWVMAYDASTLAQTSVLNVTPNGNEGGIWQAGGGLAADASGNFYFLDGNGTFETTLDGNGFPNKGDYGNGFIKVSTSGGLAVADYFNMFNTVSESNADEDLGSGAAMVLPDLTDGSGQVQHLAVGAGKDSNIYVVNREKMGKFNSSSNNIYQQLSGVLSGGVFSAPAYFNNTLYYGSVGDNLKAFTITDARLSSAPTSQTGNSFPYPGCTPGISANGTANSILWAVENSNPAVLHAYDATNLAHELYNSNQAGSRDQFGAGNKFITPTIANGRVYVGTTNGVAVFGLLP